MTKVPTTDQIRSDIDSGTTGEKIGFSDPAAAPLGTDDEAAGKPPTAEERRMAARAQPRVKRDVPLNGPMIYLGLFIVIAALIFIIGLNA